MTGCYKNLHFARVDTDRKKRRGFPEVIFCQNKTIPQIRKISREIIKAGGHLLLTRLENSGFHSFKKTFPKLKYNPKARIAFLVSQKVAFKKGIVLVMTAGTSDMSVAEEATVTL